MAVRLVDGLVPFAGRDISRTSRETPAAASSPSQAAQGNSPKVPTLFIQGSNEAVRTSLSSGTLSRIANSLGVTVGGSEKIRSFSEAKTEADRLHEGIQKEKGSLEAHTGLESLAGASAKELVN